MSKTNLPSGANPANNNGKAVRRETKTNPATSHLIIAKGENEGFVNEENFPLDGTSHKSSQRSTIQFGVSSSELLKQPLRFLHNSDRLLEETSTEQSDFYRSTEVNEILSEDEENAASGERNANFQKVQDIVDPNDPNMTCLQTDSHILHLSRLPFVPPFVPETSFERLFEVQSFLSMSSASIETTSLHSEVSAEKPEQTHILENIGEIPNITEISSDSDIIKAPIEEKPIPKKSIKSGRFVDPLTGADIPDEDEKKPEILESHETITSIAEEETVEEENADEFFFEDYDAIHSTIDGPITPAQIEENDDTLDILITKNQMQGRLEFVIDDRAEREANQRYQEMLENHVDKFLNDIIFQVVRYVEHEEHTIVLRQNLDNKKLFQKMVSIVTDIYMQSSVRRFLERKVTEYFRRRHLIRYIVPEKSDQRALEIEKKREAEERLDNILGQERFMMKKIYYKIKDLERAKTEMEEADSLETDKFEQLVRNTLKREEMPHLEELVEKDLRRIKDLGKDISAVRAAVIHQQHTLGTLKAKIEELENIGNGLRVADYEEIQRQNIAISKKIEDRNNDLSRLHDRFRNNLHVMAHSKLRNEIFARRMAQQQKNLRILENEEILCHTTVYELKKDRQKIKRQIGDLSLQSGLLDKPILLQDYDETAKNVEKSQKIVEELRHNHKRLELKLKQLEKASTTK